MGSGGSTLSSVQRQNALSDDDVEKIYQHLSVEYEKKVAELISLNEKNKSKTIQEETETLKETETETEETETIKETETETEKGKEENSDTKIESVKPRHISLEQKLLEKLQHENKLKKQVSMKALMMLGDEELEEKSRCVVPEDTKITPKLIAKLGDEKVLPEGARKRLGSGMTEDQLKLQKQQELIEKHQQEEEKRKEFNQVLNAKPDEEKKDLQGRESPVEAKALMLIGDEELEEKSRKVVTNNMKVTSKAIELAGDTALLPKKVLQRRGSDMSDAQRHKMRKHDEEERKKEEMRKKQELEKILASKATSEQKETKASKHVSAKALKLAGETSLMSDKAQKLAGGEMSAEQVKKMKEANCG